MRGQSYHGEMHVTDWLPTLMSMATNGEWSGSYHGIEIDGHDMFESIMNNLASPRNETLFLADGSTNEFALQINGVKYIRGTDLVQKPFSKPYFIFTKDLNPSLGAFECEYPSLIYDAINESSTADDMNDKVVVMNIYHKRLWIYGVLINLFLISMIILYTSSNVVLMSTSSYGNRSRLNDIRKLNSFRDEL
jgi:hypothetical protein